MKQKINNIRDLEKMKNDLLKQSAKEAAEENNIKQEDIIISTIFDNAQKDDTPEKTPEEQFATNAVEIEVEVKEDIIEDQKKELNEEENKVKQEKQKKMLDKIIYEA